VDYLTVAKQAEERFRQASGPRAPRAEPDERRSGDAGFADWVVRVVGLPLGRLEAEGGPLEVRVPWHPDTLWFVPDERHAEILACEGVRRGQIWTAREFLDVMALPDRTPELVRMLALAKIEFDGDLVEAGRQPNPGGKRAGRSDEL
jgi:hypothetical protein